MSDWSEARQKIFDAQNVTKYANVPFGDETLELSFGLLTGREFLQLQAQMDLVTLREAADSDEQNERLQELQAKEELTDEEEAELEALHEEALKENLSLMNKLDDDTLSAFQKAGRLGLKPDDEDINEALSLTQSQMEERFGEVLRTRDDAEAALTSEMRELAAESPYMIEWTVGQQVWEESQQVLGNQ